MTFTCPPGAPGPAPVIMSAKAEGAQRASRTSTLSRARWIGRAAGRGLFSLTPVIRLPRNRFMLISLVGGVRRGSPGAAPWPSPVRLLLRSTPAAVTAFSEVVRGTVVQWRKAGLQLARKRFPASCLRRFWSSQAPQQTGRAFRLSEVCRLLSPAAETCHGEGRLGGLRQGRTDPAPRLPSSVLARVLPARNAGRRRPGASPPGLPGLRRLRLCPPQDGLRP